MQSFLLSESRLVPDQLLCLYSETLQFLLQSSLLHVRVELQDEFPAGVDELPVLFSLTSPLHFSRIRLTLIRVTLAHMSAELVRLYEDPLAYWAFELLIGGIFGSVRAVVMLFLLAILLYWIVPVTQLMAYLVLLLTSCFLFFVLCRFFWVCRQFTSDRILLEQFKLLGHVPLFMSLWEDGVIIGNHDGTSSESRLSIFS